MDQTLRCLVRQRLSAAAEEIFGLFERTIAEYEEELCRSKEENERQQKILDAVLQPEVRLHRAVFPADVQQSLPPEQQDWSSSLDQEDPEPPHIKEEPEEVWTSQEGGQLQGLEEADITKFPFTPVPVKSEDDEEEPQSSQLHQRHTEQMETGADGEDCGGPEPDRNSDPDRHLQPDTEDQNEDSCETGVSDGEWKETREPQSGLNSPVSDVRCKAGEKPFRCSECGKIFYHKRNLETHMKIHTGEKPFSCSVCGKRSTYRASMIQHMAVHTGERRYSCSVCGKRFTWSSQVKSHRCVDGPSQLKSFSCSKCSRTFNRNTNLRAHMRIHTGEKPFSCSVCDKRFAWHNQLQTHLCVGRQSSRRQSPTEESREIQQMETGADGEDCGGPEPARNCDSDRHLQPDTEDRTEDSGFWKETREPQSGLNSLKQNEVSQSDEAFSNNLLLKTQKRTHPAEKPFSLSQQAAVHPEVHMEAKQEDQEPPNIKEEPEEVWTSQEGGQLQGLEEADITKFPFTPVPVKSEDDEEEPQSSQLHQRHTEQMETGADGEDCGGPEPDRNSDPDRHLQPDTEDQNEDSSEPETDDSEDWTETREHRPGLKTLKNNNVPVSGVTGEKPLLLHSCTECGKRFGNKTNLKVHMRTHTGENSFSCLLCGKVFTQGGNLRQHMVVHAGENSLKCSVCSKRFTWYKQFKTHKCGGLQSSQLHERQTKQMKTRADGKDCGGPEPGTRSSRRTTRR